MSGMTGGHDGELPDSAPDPASTPGIPGAAAPASDTRAAPRTDDAGDRSASAAHTDTTAHDDTTDTPTDAHAPPAADTDTTTHDDTPTDVTAAGPLLGAAVGEPEASGERYDDGFAARSTVGVPAMTAYRSTEDRNRSVYRRANPWYRRLARGVIAACLIGGLAVGVYYGARAVQSYLGRERLPEAEPDIPEIRATTVILAASNPAIQLEGTLTFDAQSRSFEFVGTPNTANATDHLTSPDGQTVLQQGIGTTWIRLGETNELAATVKQAVQVLAGSSTADVVLTNRIRSDYVELVRQIDEGEGDDALTRYDVRLDLRAFADDYPLQWDEFRTTAIPGVAPNSPHDVSMWLDDEQVLVRFSDVETGWNWDRIDYSATPYSPLTPDPGNVEGSIEPGATTVVCAISDLGLTYTTGLGTCDNADAVGRQFAVEVGLAIAPDDPAARLAFVSVCTAIQGDDPVEYTDEAYAELAGKLDAALVCPGNPDLVTIADG